MELMKFVAVTRKYKKCPSCGSSWKETNLKAEVADEVITITCTCGFLKRVDENNKEVE